MTRHKYGTPNKGDGIQNGTRNPATEPIQSVPAESQEAKLAKELRTAKSQIAALARDLGVFIPEKTMGSISKATDILDKIEQKDMLDSMDVRLCAINLEMVRDDIINFLRKNAGYFLSEDNKMIKPLTDTAEVLKQKANSMW